LCRVVPCSLFPFASFPLCVRIPGRTFFWVLSFSFGGGCAVLSRASFFLLPLSLCVCVCVRIPGRTFLWCSFLFFWMRLCRVVPYPPFVFASFLLSFVCSNPRQGFIAISCYFEAVVPCRVSCLYFLLPLFFYPKDSLTSRMSIKGTSHGFS